MSLTDFPTVKPTENQIFIIALSIIIFIFFFTERKESDAQQIG
ncbi:hypothetical protein [Bacillus sp. OK048]|nr:hypothetical protein [Bacillus sp. OK048]SDM71377.1 hypothetical protein SAMN05443253_10581 [Bacillus sp. OK048]